MSKKSSMESKQFSQAVGRALRRAAKVARKTARMHGTPIYVWENGKVVAKKREAPAMTQAAHVASCAVVTRRRLPVPRRLGRGRSRRAVSRSPGSM